MNPANQLNQFIEDCSSAGMKIAIIGTKCKNDYIKPFIDIYLENLSDFEISDADILIIPKIDDFY